MFLKGRNCTVLTQTKIAVQHYSFCQCYRYAETIAQPAESWPTETVDFRSVHKNRHVCASVISMRKSVDVQITCLKSRGGAVVKSPLRTRADAGSVLAIGIFLNLVMLLFFFSYHLFIGINS